jgi:hypothetical protein
MPGDHRPAMPQITAVDDQFGTHPQVKAKGSAARQASQAQPRHAAHLVALDRAGGHTSAEFRRAVRRATGDLEPDWRPVEVTVARFLMQVS